MVVDLGEKSKELKTKEGAKSETFNRGYVVLKSSYTVVLCKEAILRADESSLQCLGSSIHRFVYIKLDSKKKIEDGTVNEILPVLQKTAIRRDLNRKGVETEIKEKRYLFLEEEQAILVAFEGRGSVVYEVLPKEGRYFHYTESEKDEAIEDLAHFLKEGDHALVISLFKSEFLGRHMKEVRRFISGRVH